MIKYTLNNLEKMKALLQEAGYIVRFEKGHFTAGYCLLENKKVIIVNKYFDTEARITTLQDIIATLQLSEEKLSEHSQSFLKQIQPARL